MFSSKPFLKSLLPYILLLISLPLCAQEYQVSIKSWDIKDGMSDRQVNGICKDRRGFIWACTRKGLNRFDGYNFKVYTKEKDGLPFNYLKGIVEDANGSLWVSGNTHFDGHDIFIFDPLTKKVQSFRDKTGYQPTVRIDFLLKINDSLLFFGSRKEKFFFTWHPRLGLRKILYPVPFHGLLSVTGHNTFWIKNDSSEACEINMEGALLRKTVPAPGFAEQESSISSNGEYLFNLKQKSAYKLASDITVKNWKWGLANAYGPYAGIFDTGTDNVVSGWGKLYDPQIGFLVDFVKENLPRLSTGTPQVILTNNGEIWIASGLGLFMVRVSRNKFRKYFFQDIKTFTRNSYRNLVVDHNKLYAANEFQGVTRTNIDTTKKSDYLNCPSPRSGNYTMIKTHEGLIIRLRDDCFYSLNKNGTAWSTVKLHEPDIKHHAWKIYEAANDSFLIGADKGIGWFNLGTHTFLPFYKYNGYNTLAGAIVTDILPDKTGQVWICSNAGLYAYDNVRGVTARYSSADTGTHFLPTGEFQHLFQDADGIYWLATTSGLIKWDKAHNKYRLYTQEDGLSNNNIYAVYEDGFARLWLTSDYGLMRFNKATGKVRTYLIDDGITFNEFNKISHTRDSAGNLYFGTLDGVTAFDPKDFPNDSSDEKNVPLAISSFEQFNGKTNRIEDRTAELVHTNAITLHPGDRFFTINFALLTYDDLIHNNYFWKIDGIDSEWNSMREPVLRISGLPYGNMTLHIKAQAGDGSWGKNELAFSVNVIKPVYLRTWFIVLSVVVLIFGFLGWYRRRITRLKRENARLDRIVQEKTSALEEKTVALEKTVNELKLSSQQKDVLMKEIHHRVKNNLQVITSLLNLQLGSIKDEAARISVEEGVSRISSIALIHHQLYAGDELAAFELSGFTQALFAQVYSVYRKGGQKIILQNDIPATLFDIDTALPLGLVLNELMTNSFKYAYNNTGEGTMKINLVLAGDKYSLKYCDNGPGLPDGYELKSAASLGIKIIRNLSKQLGGGFSYNRADNCFTVVFLVAAARKNKA